ncbi:valine--tRNA ligase, partial [Solemya velum gill symbiont]
WYLELCKPVLNSDEASDAAKRGTRQTLVRVLEALLRLAHPIIPFITEEIWQQVAPLAGKSGDSIMLQPYPLADESLEDQQAVAEVEWLKNIILAIRKIKGEMNIAPGKRVPVLLADASEQDRKYSEINRSYLDFLARVESITILEQGDEEPESAVALIGDMRLLIPMSGLIDKDAECKRLEKEIGKAESEVERTGKKLQNPNFVDKAPEAVVAKEKEKLEEAQKTLASLQAQLEKIQAL